MILSISRRTDIPAFYSDWLLGRLRHGSVLVRNPINPRQVGRILISPQTTSCLLFWSKNPRPLLHHLPEIDALGYRCAFLFTLTAYGPEVETNLPPLAHRLETFRALARAVGRDGICWRYDPIFFSKRYTPAFHRQAFAALASALEGFSQRCIISFVEMYQKCRRNMAPLAPQQLPLEERLALLESLAAIAKSHRFELQSCASPEDLGTVITPGRCIDPAWLSKHLGTPIVAAKDKSQRGACGCAASIDIGAYHSCPHGCRYCYANHNLEVAKRNFAAHDPDSPLLLGTLGEKDQVRDRQVPTPAQRQPRLF